MLDKFLFKDSKGFKSVTVTAFVLGFIVVNVKLMVSGLSVGGLVMSDFGGGDYAAAVGALGAVYVLRRATDNNKEEK